MGETIATLGAGVIGGAIVLCLRKSKDVYRVIATRRKIEKIRSLEGLV
jgi:pyrroline-5-carboxylate reductase